MERSYKTEAELAYKNGKWLTENICLPPYMSLGACGNIAVFAIKLLAGDLKGRTVADIGGGDGTILHYIGGNRARLALICDIALSPLKRCPFASIEGNALSLPMKDETVDIIITSDMLEHLRQEDIKPVMKEISRVVKRNGRVVIHTSCFGYYLRRLGIPFTGRNRLDRFDLEDGHKNRLTRDELIKTAYECGLVIRREIHYKHLFQPLLRRLKSMIMKGRGNNASKLMIKEMNVVTKIVRYIFSLLSFFDIILFSNIPGGSIIAEFRKL
ncbi:MAG: hypothetical protein DRH49_01915 [Candidatus Coatesbacteria bacterium]|nr:MAG: hypothetical protein DRH49_01915 [Candidatus Coatesbacteria bacterium]